MRLCKTISFGSQTAVLLSLVLTACGGGGGDNTGTGATPNSQAVVSVTPVSPTQTPVQATPANPTQPTQPTQTLQPPQPTQTPQPPQPTPPTQGTPVPDANARTALAAEPTGSQCADPVGGISITAFIDANSNGIRDGAEVSSTQYVCYQPPGPAGTASTTGMTALASLTNEPAGTNCTQGGKRFTVGLDTNSNGVLEASEARPPAFLCNSTGPDVNISIIDEARGGNCANAGKQISTTNGTGTTINYVCYTAPGLAMTWKRISTAATQLVSGLGHIISNFSAGTVVATLPENAAVKVGDTLALRGESANSWRIAQNAGQTIGARKLGGIEPGLDASWIQQSEPVHNWWFVASSNSGNKLAAVTNDFLTAPGAPKLGSIYISADAGATWTERTLPGNRAWASIASSADGSKLAAVASDLSAIWTSADSGSTWQEQLDSGKRFWVSITMSSDGSRMAAVALEEGKAVGDGKIYTWAQSASNAFGAGPWTARTPALNWRSIASSADGSKLVAALYSDVLDAQQPIYLSTDFGVSWTPSPAFPVGQATHSFYRVASSQDGSKLAAAERFGKIYTSSDSGLSWTARTPDGGFNSLAMSSDGNTVVAVQPVSSDPLGGQIYISTDGGVTWALRQKAKAWRGVAVSADGNRIVAAVNNGGIYTSASNRTTAGTAGGITGGQTNELQLRYLGDGLFDTISASGLGFTVN
jgi:hypothetical protein